MSGAYMRDWLTALKADDRLGFTTKSVGRWVSDYADYNTGKDVRVSLARLAADSGGNEKTFRRHIPLLVDAGYLEWHNPPKDGKSSNGTVNKFSCTMPPTTDSQSTVDGGVTTDSQSGLPRTLSPEPRTLSPDTTDSQSNDLSSTFQGTSQETSHSPRRRGGDRQSRSLSLVETPETPLWKQVYG